MKLLNFRRHRGASQVRSSDVAPGKVPGSSGPTCPACGRRKSKTSDTRPSGDMIRRRRQCQCGRRFTTFETVAVECAIDFQI